jgi:hypothetical protein
MRICRRLCSQSIMLQCAKRMTLRSMKLERFSKIAFSIPYSASQSRPALVRGLASKPFGTD